MIADAHHVHEQLEAIAGMLGRQFPKLEAMLRDSPVPYWSKPTTRCFYVLSIRRSGRWSQLALHEAEQLAG